MQQSLFQSSSLWKFILVLITKIEGALKFLKSLRNLYSAFSVHLKHKTSDKVLLSDAVDAVKECEETYAIAHQKLNRIKETNDPEGTISSKTLKSVDILASGFIT